MIHFPDMPLMTLKGFIHQTRQCDVCRYKRMLCYAVPKEDFIAHHYHLTHDENWVCSDCWVKVKVHDPKKGEFTVRFDGGKQGFFGASDEEKSNDD